MSEPSSPCRDPLVPDSLEPTTRYKSLYIEEGDQSEAAKSLVDNKIEEDLSLIDSKDSTDRCERLELLA